MTSGFELQLEKIKKKILFLVLLALILGVRFDLSPSPLVGVKCQCFG